MRTVIGIGAVSMPSERDLDTGLARIARVIAAARRRGADLIVLPEFVIGGALDESDSVGLPPALDLDGPEVAVLRALAGDAVVVAGLTEAGGPYSTAVAISGDGVLGVHRKVHLPPTERFAFRPGSGFAAFDTPVGRLGLMLCYDKLFPEAARSLVLDGAEIIACPAAWPVDRHRPARRVADDRQVRHFATTAAARAVENQVVWVSANLAGPFGPLRFPGGSRIVDPDGVVRAKTGVRPGMAFARLDVAAELESARLHIDHLADRRAHAYTEGGDWMRGAVTG